MRSAIVFRATFSSLLSALPLVACAASQPPPEAQHVHVGAFVEGLCNTLCEKQVHCDHNLDAETCQTNCRQRGSPAREFWREDYAKATLACLDTSGCDVMRSGDTIGKKCFEETRPEPSDAAKHFCEVSEAKEQSCTAAPPNVPACLRTWGMMKDTALAEMVACQDRACGKATSCAKAVVGFPKPAGE